MKFFVPFFWCNLLRKILLTRAIFPWTNEHFSDCFKTARVLNYNYSYNIHGYLEFSTWSHGNIYACTHTYKITKKKAHSNKRFLSHTTYTYMYPLHPATVLDFLSKVLEKKRWKLQPWEFDFFRSRVASSVLYSTIGPGKLTRENSYRDRGTSTVAQLCRLFFAR